MGSSGAAEEEHAQGGFGIYKKCEFAVIVLHYNNPEPCQKYIAVLTLVVPSRLGICFIERLRRFPAEAGGNTFVRLMLEFIVIPTNSIVIILSSVVQRPSGGQKANVSAGVVVAVVHSNPAPEKIEIQIA